MPPYCSRLVCLVLALSLLLSACGPQAPATAIPAPTQVSGQVATAAQDGGAAGPTPTPAPTLPPDNRTNNPIGLVIPPAEGSPANAAARLAQGLAQAASADQAAPLIAETLTWAGIAIYDPSGQRINHPVEPASQLRLFDFQVYGLALDYANQGGLTIGELAQALSEANSALDGEPVSPDLLQDLLSNWTTLAGSASPDSWEVFTPLFLLALNREKSIAVDLAYTGYDEDLLFLTTLELALIASAHVRDGSPSPDTLGLTGGVVKLARPLSDNGCAEWNKSQEAAFGKWGSGGTGWAAGELLGEAWDMLGQAAGKAAGAAMQGAGKAFGWLLTAITTLAGVTAWEFNIRADPNPAHYKHNESGDVFAYFIATIKVNEKWPRWFADCLKTFGMDMPSNSDLSSARIRWVPIRKIPPHAVVKPENENGRLEENFTSAGEARLKLIMAQEKNGDWETAPEKKDHVTVRGELFRDNSLPGPELLIQAASGNIPGALLPVLMKWFDKWFPKKAYGRMNVTYHKIVPMVFRKEGVSAGLEWTALGYNCEGIYGNWTINISGSSEEQGFKVVLNTSIQGTLPKDGDGQYTGNQSISASVDTAPIAAELQASLSGKLKLGGTKDAPVLVLHGDPISGKASGSAPDIQISMPLTGPGGAPYGVAIKEDPEFGQCR